MSFTAPAVEDVPTVAQMVASMDRTVAGMEAIKKRLALALRRHVISGILRHGNHPPNLLIIGGSGSGKTYLLRAALESIPCVWTEANATAYSDTGYTGPDLASMYSGLLGPRWRGKRGGEERPLPKEEMLSLAERFGVVVIDEFDKLRYAGKRDERQVGRALQAELLKMAEGTEVAHRQNDNDPGFEIATHGIMHIAVGAFQGLNGVISDRLDWPEGDPQFKGAFQHTQIEDVIAYGFLEELVGRFSTILPLPVLDNAAMARILREQLVPAYAQQVADSGLTLHVDEGAIHTLAAVGHTSNIGARALAPKLEACLWAGWAEAEPGDELVIDAEHAQRGTCAVRRHETVAA